MKIPHTKTPGAAEKPTTANRREKNLRQISVLFASGRSHYAHLPGCDVWNRQRDAKYFAGTDPVIAHPPCRTWSKYLRHQAKPLDLRAEQELGIFAAWMVMKNGGVLEQPAGSHLWPAANLPALGDLADPFCYTIQVEQGWWGMATRKKTWLLICGVPCTWLPEYPFRFDPKPNSQVWNNHAQRGQTPIKFAEWLIEIARLVWYR